MDQLVGALFIWLAAVFSQTERLATNEKLRMFRWDIPKKWIAISLVVIATAGLGWQTYQTLKTKKVIEETKQQVEDLREANSKLFNEASGGTIVNDFAYVVDDEKPDVFVFRLDGEYQLIERMPLKENGTVLTGDKVDDLEAIASADGKLYLITSHSNTKKAGEPKRARQKLLEVSLAPGSRGEVSNKADNLRDVIWKSLKGLADSYLNEEHQDEGMQIEGFAIDKEGNAYIGLRAPLSRVGNYAVVLRAKLADLFSKDKEPQFKVILIPVNLSVKNEPYGIVSLDYDAQTGMMLIVGNSVKNTGYLDPILCQWDVELHKDDSIQNPTTCKPIPPYKVFGSTSHNSKIELLLLPSGSKSDRVFMFLDTDDKGSGGQLSYTRNELGLVK